MFTIALRPVFDFTPPVYYLTEAEGWDDTRPTPRSDTILVLLSCIKEVAADPGDQHQSMADMFLKIVSLYLIISVMGHYLSCFLQNDVPEDCLPREGVQYLSAPNTPSTQLSASWIFPPWLGYEVIVTICVYLRSVEFVSLTSTVYGITGVANSDVDRF